jgi:hypothetical protein
MGLDAVVYCDCFESGRIREPPPVSLAIKVAEDGSLEWRDDDFLIDLALNYWLNERACHHAGGILVSHRIGNVALVEFLRGELSRSRDLFPVLLEKVLYSGTHCGDYLLTDEVLKLREELVELADFTCSEAEHQPYMEEFRQQMDELVESALSVGKPIVF